MNTWHIQYIVRGNPWDAKRNATTAFVFGFHTQEASSTLGRATCGMQNTGKLSQHTKRPVQCAGQSNVTKYCACHEKLLANIIATSPNCHKQSHNNITKSPNAVAATKMTLMIDPPPKWNVHASGRSNRSFRPNKNDPSMIRPWSQIMSPPDSESLPVPSWQRILHGKNNTSGSSYLPKFHEMIRACHE